MFNIVPQKRGSWLSNLSLTTWIIIINVIIFILTLIFSAVYSEEVVYKYLALTPSLVLAGQELWTFFTSMFVHAGFFHLFANMFSLFFIGKFVEKLIGRKRYFWIYIIAGLVGGLFYVAACIIFGGVNNPAVGASGAIFGLLGILAVIVPRSKVYLITGPLLLIVAEVILQEVLPEGVFSVLGVFINILLFVMIFAMFSFNSKFRKVSLPLELPMWVLPIVAIVPLVIIGYFVELPIGNSAHFGGLVVGLIYGFYLRKKFPNKTKKISQMFAGK